MNQYFENDFYEDDFDEEFGGKIVRHISNGEESINVIRKNNDDVYAEDFYLGNMNDSDIEDKLDDFENGWLETHWSRSDWAYHYGCDEEDVEDCMDDDMRDWD